MVAGTPKLMQDMSKVETLDDTNYHRWLQRLMILFEAMDIEYVLHQDPPMDKAGDTTLMTPTTTPVAVTTKKAKVEAIEKYDRDNKTV